MARHESGTQASDYKNGWQLISITLTWLVRHTQLVLGSFMRFADKGDIEFRADVSRA
jgi:hypothetical protein